MYSTCNDSEASFPILEKQSAINSYNCFLVQKVSHSGTLFLYSDHILFIYASGEENESTNLQYTQITDVVVESRLARTMNNLEIHTENQLFVFSGLHESENVKNYILLLKKDELLHSASYGFIPAEKKYVSYAPLKNPILLFSQSLPSPIQSVIDLVTSNDFYITLNQIMGNEDTIIQKWEQLDGYKERILTYNKSVVLPVLGKNLIKIVETQRLFELENQYVLVIELDLGKTPYASCFDPHLHVVFVNNKNTTELNVNFEMIWSSEPFVKAIIDSKTTQETKDQYIAFSKLITKELIGKDEDENKEENTNSNSTANENREDKFKKFRYLYKITIMILSFVFICMLIWYNWPENGLELNTNTIYTLLCDLFFVAEIIFR